jgi:mono/diheme cytochrome c family protein
MKRAILIATYLSSALCAAACGPGRRSEAILGPAPLVNHEQLAGQRLYMEFCNQCHPGGDSGLGPALNNKPLPNAAIKLQVRKGIGAMPKFSDTLLTDDQLQAIVEYVVAKRKQG